MTGKGRGDEWRSGLTMGEVWHFCRDLEKEFGVSVVYHVWPDLGPGGRWRFAVRVEAVRAGTGYRGVVKAHWYEQFPGGRAASLVGCMYRALVELWGELDAKRPE